MMASATDRALAAELRRHFNETGFPVTHAVPRDVYEAVERVILDHLEQLDRDYPLETHVFVIGPHGGLMFKNVELQVAV